MLYWIDTETFWRNSWFQWHRRGVDTRLLFARHEDFVMGDTSTPLKKPHLYTKTGVIWFLQVQRKARRFRNCRCNSIYVSSHVSIIVDTSGKMPGAAGKERIFNYQEIVDIVNENILHWIFNTVQHSWKFAQRKTTQFTFTDFYRPDHPTSWSWYLCNTYKRSRAQLNVSGDCCENHKHQDEFIAAIRDTKQQAISKIRTVASRPSVHIWPSHAMANLTHRGELLNSLSPEHIGSIVNKQ